MKVRNFKIQTSFFKLPDTAMKNGLMRYFPSAFFIAITWVPALLVFWMISATPDTTSCEGWLVVAMLVGVHVIGGGLGLIGKPESHSAHLWVLLAPMVSFVVWIVIASGYGVFVRGSSAGDVLRGVVLTSIAVVLLCAPAAGMARQVQIVRGRCGHVKG